LFRCLWGVRGDAGDVWRAAIGCGGVVGARGWPLAVHVCCESRLLPWRRACDEHKYCRAMQRQNMSMRCARARVAGISLCSIAHASSILRMCSRTLVCHVCVERQHLSRLARFCSVLTHPRPTYVLQIARVGLGYVRTKHRTTNRRLEGRKNKMSPAVAPRPAEK